MMEDLRRAATALRESTEVVLACHVGPDGDALGSMLGMASILRANGKTVFPSFGEPFVVPDSYRFLPLDLLVAPSDVPAEPSLMVTFDAGSIDRLGSLGAQATKAKELIVIDHHVSNDGFGTIDLIDPEAAATAEVCVGLLGALGWSIDDVSATCFQTALVTDTGRFQYSNTTPVTLETAAAMVRAGARPEEIGQYVYEEVPFGYLGLASAVLGRARLDTERRLVWSVMTRADLEEAGIGMDDTDPLIDALRVARESDVAMLIKEAGADRHKVSLRSRGRVDVGAIAVDLGGGGHHNAAGFTFPGPAEEAARAVISRLAPVA